MIRKVSGAFVGVLLASLLVSECLAEGPRKLSLGHGGSGPGQDASSLRVYEAKVEPVAGTAYVYATFQMGPANPIEYVEGLPQWQPNAPKPSKETGQPEGEEKVEVPGGFVMRMQHPPAPKRKGRPEFLQTVTLGQRADDELTPVLKFGLADDGRVQEKAHVTTWVSDGYIDYHGLHVRPDTPYDFKFKLDLKNKRMTAWVAGRGDDDWFLLVDDVPLTTKAMQINEVQVQQYPGGPAIEDLMVLPQPCPAAERLKDHPAAKKNRVVGPDKGFKFQLMRSTWRKPGKHVTIFRKPGVHAGFPDVAQAGPDHLVCVWRNGSHTGGTGGLSVAHSYDLGKTWTEPVLVTRLGGNCPRLGRLKDGTLLLLVDVASGGNQFVATWDLVLWDSTDGGKTWTNERWLRAKQVGGGGCIVPSRICEMADGSWLLAASYFAPPPGGGSWVEILDYYRSADRGQTWQFVSQPNHYPPSSLSEPSPIQLPDGRLVVYARESRADGMPGAKGYSKDGGKTWDYHQLPHPITGRTCANLLHDGRVMNTFRSGVGRAALRACIADPDDMTTSQPAGGHFNDRHTVGLKDGALHIDNDGVCGQFTKYNLKPPLSDKSTVDLSAEVKVLANAGRAATIAIPLAGKLRIFPDHVVMAHDPKLRVDVAPGEFHTYRVVSKLGNMKLYVDGELKLDTDKGDGSVRSLPWVKISRCSLGFGNEVSGPASEPDVYPIDITPEVTGYSIWRSVEVALEDPETGREVTSWSASKDGFPDQYQLDHIIEVEASANGHDQGYSGWIQLEDGRIFVVHYTDDASAASRPNPHRFGVPWIRGTFLSPDDLPPQRP